MSSLPLVRVLGAGVTGLTSAVCLRRAGYAVEVLAAGRGQSLVSSVAAGSWECPPYMLGTGPEPVEMALDTYHHLDRLAGREVAGRPWKVAPGMDAATAPGNSGTASLLPAPAGVAAGSESWEAFPEADADTVSGVTRVRMVTLSRTSMEGRTNPCADQLSNYEHSQVLATSAAVFSPGGVTGQGGDVELVNTAGSCNGYADGQAYDGFVADMRIYLPWLERQARALGVMIRHHTAASLDGDMATGHILVNATGLGARRLAQDEHVHPTPGQLFALQLPEGVELRAEVADTDTGLYIIPRRDGLVMCGGVPYTSDDPWSTVPDPANTEACLTAVRAMCPALERAAMVPGSLVVGLRPTRRGGLRLELERRASDGAVCIHNYGHGGSGISVSWGAAMRLVELVKQASA